MSDSWIAAQKTPICLTASPTRRKLRLTVSSGESVEVDFADARALFETPELAARKIWVTDGLAFSRRFAADLADWGDPKLWCARTLLQAVAPTQQPEALEPGQGTAHSIETAMQAPASTRRAALVVSREEQTILRPAAIRGWRADMPRLIAHRRRLRGGAQAFRNAYGVDVFGPAKVIDGWLKTIGVDAAYRDGFLHLDESTLRRTTDLTAYRSLRSAWKLRKWDSVLKGIQSQVIAGRIYPDRWTANSSVSGRQTISGPGIYGLRADLRDVIRADPGKKIVSVDHHAAEIRVLAAMSGDDSLIRSVLQGDPYQELADATGLDRKLCKTAMLATLYGQGAAAAAAKYGNNTAAAIRSTIFALWPGLGRYAKNLRRLAAAGEPLHTLGGRPVPAQAKPHTALALVTQGSARDVFAICTKRAHDEGLDIWLTYHDALYVQASAADTAHVGEVLLRCMTYELSHGVTLSGQVDISESWH